MTHAPAPVLMEALEDGALAPVGGRHRAEAARQFEPGKRYRIVQHQDRNMASHRHEFAWLREAWNSLPEECALEAWAVSPDALRKYALIRTGFCTTEIYTCGSKAEAQRWAMNLRGMREDFAIVAPKGSTVQVFTAKSQSTKAMDKAEFEASKKAILDFIAGLIGVDPDDLSQQKEPA